MWTRLVSTRPVSDPKLKDCVDVSLARKQSNIRAQCLQPHTHGGSLWVVACRLSRVACRNNATRSPSSTLTDGSRMRMVTLQLTEIDCQLNDLSARVSQRSVLSTRGFLCKRGWCLGTSPRRWPLGMLAHPSSWPHHWPRRCAHDLDQPCCV